MVSETFTALVRSFRAPGGMGSSVSGPFVILVSGKPKKRTKIFKYIIFLQRALLYVILNVEIIENFADGRKKLSKVLGLGRLPNKHFAAPPGRKNSKCAHTCSACHKNLKCGHDH